MRIAPGQVAVITGGACGIGMAVARELASRKVRLVIADIHQPSVDEALQNLGALGADVLGVETDVSDAASVQSLAEATLKHFGRVDLLVNNAGHGGKAMPIWEYERVEWEWVFGVNLWGVVNGIRAFVPHLIEAGSGHVVNVASMAGLVPVPMFGAYNAAKRAVVAITETLASDLAERATGVGATVVCPGPTNTRLMAEGPREVPAHLRPSRVAGVDSRRNPHSLAASAGSRSTPEDVAIAMMAAIERNQLYVTPHRESAERVAAWFRRVDRDVGTESSLHER